MPPGDGEDGRSKADQSCSTALAPFSFLGVQGAQHSRAQFSGELYVEACGNACLGHEGMKAAKVEKSSLIHPGYCS